MLDQFQSLQFTAAISFLFVVYGTYLNWKQAKVDVKMDILINEVKELHKTIKNGGL